MPKGLSEPIHDWWNNQSVEITASPSVVTARVKPRTRSAGSPTRTVTSAPAPPASRKSDASDQPWVAMWAVM